MAGMDEVSEGRGLEARGVWRGGCSAGGRGCGGGYEYLIVPATGTPSFPVHSRLFTTTCTATRYTPYEISPLGLYPNYGWHATEWHVMSCHAIDPYRTGELHLSIYFRYVL